MPEFHDGPFHSSGIPRKSTFLYPPGSPTAQKTEHGLTRPDPAIQVRGQAVTHALRTSAYSDAKWKRVAQKLWHGRDKAAECPQWEPFEDDSAFPLHHGLEPGPGLTMAGGAGPFHESALDPWALVAGTAEQALPLPRRLARASVLTFPIAPVTTATSTSAAKIRTDDVLVSFPSPDRQSITIFSLVGGTGRTSIAASLARMLAGSGLRVLLVDTCAHSLLPRLFGAGESRQGVIRKFLPASGGRTQMVSLVSLAVEAFAGDDSEQYRILHEFTQETTRFDRVVWDLGGAPLDWAAKVLSVSPEILVPLLPDTNSLVQLRATERFLHHARLKGTNLHWRYVLNNFDEGDAGHVDMRGRFRQILGDQLLRGALRRSPLVDEALSMGRTVVDHAAASPLVSDLWRMARQLHQLDSGKEDVPAVISEWVEQ